jgi:hypothetical protein
LVAVQQTQRHRHHHRRTNPTVISQPRVEL